MGRGRYQFNQSHFTTITVLHWIAVFTRPETAAILLNSLRQLREAAGKNIPSSSPRRRGSIAVVDSRLRGNDESRYILQCHFPYARVTLENPMHSGLSIGDTQAPEIILVVMDY